MSSSLLENIKNADTSQSQEITANSLKQYFSGTDYRTKTKETWTESTTERLGKIDQQQKDQLKSAIDSYLRQGLMVEQQDGTTCPAVEVITQATTFADAMKLVKAESGKSLNICAALLSLHRFLDTGNRLLYDGKQGASWYANKFCNNTPVVKKEEPTLIVAPTTGIGTNTTTNNTGGDIPTVDTPKVPQNKPQTTDDTGGDMPTFDAPKAPQNKPQTTDDTGGDMPTFDAPKVPQNKPKRKERRAKKKEENNNKKEDQTVKEVKSTSTSSPQSNSEQQSKLNNSTFQTQPQSFLISEVKREREQRLDGIPTVITTGMKEIEDHQRKEYLVDQMNSFLKSRIIGKDILGNNKQRENNLLNSFFSSLSTLPPELQRDDVEYDEVNTYYKNLIDALTGTDRIQGNKLKIPASVKSYDRTTKRIEFNEVPKKGLGIINNNNIELSQGEVKKLKELLTSGLGGKPGLSQQMEYIHEQTTDKIYTLGMKKSEKYDEKNPLLDAYTNTYKDLNGSFLNTSERIKSLSQKLSTALGTLSNLKAQQKALETKNPTNPKDIVTKQFDLAQVTEQLFNAEMEVISLGIQHDILTNGTVSTKSITSRLKKIEADLVKSREKMKTWIDTEGPKQKNAVSAESDKTFIQRQLDTMQSFVDKTEKDKGRINAMITTMNNDIYKNYEADMKTLQGADTIITQQTQAKIKYEEELKSLDIRDPNYDSKKEKLNTHITTCNTEITTQGNLKNKIINKYKNYSSGLTNQSQLQKTNSKTTEQQSLEEKQQSLEDQKQIRDGLTKDNIPLLAMTQFPTLYTEAKSDKWDKDLTAKQDQYQNNVSTELQENTDKNTKEKETISTEKEQLQKDIDTVESDITVKENEIKTELAKASSTDGYDTSLVASKTTELLTLYTKRSNLLDQRNDNYTKSQFNYQRELFNQKTYIDGFVDHTASNVEKIKNQKKQVETEWTNKMARITEYYNEYIAINKIGEQDNEVKQYLDAEKTRIQTQACILAQELFGTEFKSISDVKSSAIDKKGDPATDQAPTSSLLRKRYDIAQQLITENEQLTKWKLTQGYQQSLLNLAEVTGQHNVMEAKLNQYGRDKEKIEDNIKSYNSIITKNTEDIAKQQKELNEKIERDPTDSQISTLQGEIDQKEASNTELNAQITILTDRMNNLTTVIDKAQNVFTQMQTAKTTAENAKKTAKDELDKDNTLIYTDEKTTSYELKVPGGDELKVPGGDFNKDWDPKRVIYENPSLSNNDPKEKKNP